MKKVLSSAVFAAMLFGSASMASAATLDYYGDLQRIVYDPTQLEIITSIPNAIDPGTGALGADDFGLANFKAGTTWGNLEVAYWGLKVTGTGPLAKLTDIYFSSNHSSFTTATPLLDFINTAQIPQHWSAFNSVTSVLTGEVTKIANPATDGVKSYTNYFKTDGQLASLLRMGNTAEASLSPFDAAGNQYVDQYVYHMNYDTVTRVWSFIEGENTDYMYVIRTNEDGYSSEVVVPSSAVPVPGAVWLLGSGLMGLVGLRRKNAGK